MRTTKFKDWTLSVSDPVYPNGGRYRAFLNFPSGACAGIGMGDTEAEVVDAAEKDYQRVCAAFGSENSTEAFLVSQLVAIGRFHPAVTRQLIALLEQRPALTREQLIPEGERIFAELQQT